MGETQLRPKQGPLRVLIVRVGAMGDVLHGLPAVSALRRSLPECFVGWAIEPRWSALLMAEGARTRGLEMPVVDRVHAVRTREWKRKPFSAGTLRGIRELRRELQAERYDVCVDLQGSIRSGLIGWMAEARRFVGASETREQPAAMLYGDRVEVQARHVIAGACELVSAAIGTQVNAAAVELPRDPEAEQWCELMLSESEAGKVFVLLCPGAGWGAKQWPAARYAELALALHAKGFQVLVNGGSAEGDGVEAVTAASGARAVRCDLGQLIALSRRAALVVGGDTGPVHLAAALGRPVVALFGPTDPLRNGPDFPGARLRVLRHASSGVDYRRHTETEAGLGRIGVDEVLAACQDLLDEVKRQDG